MRTKQFLALLKKDFRLQYKDFAGILSIFFFCVILLLLFHFALSLSQKEKLSVGIFWIAFFLGNNLLFQRSQTIDKTAKVFERILLAPLPRFFLMLAKLLHNFFLCLLLQLLLLPIFATFFDERFLLDFPKIIILLVAASLGFCALGTLITSLTVELRLKEIIVPLLLFPLSIPLLLASIRLMEGIFFNSTTSDFLIGIQIITAFDLIYLALCWLTYEVALN